MPSLLLLKQLEIELWRLLFVKGIKEQLFAGPSLLVAQLYLDVNAGLSNIPLCGLLAATPRHIETSPENLYAL